MDLFGPFHGPSLACKILGANSDETLLFATYVVVIKLLILFISCALETKGSRLLKMFLNRTVVPDLYFWSDIQAIMFVIHVSHLQLNGTIKIFPENFAYLCLK